MVVLEEINFFDSFKFWKSLEINNSEQKNNGEEKKEIFPIEQADVLKTEELNKDTQKKYMDFEQLVGENCGPTGFYYTIKGLIKKTLKNEKKNRNSIISENDLFLFKKYLKIGDINRKVDNIFLEVPYFPNTETISIKEIKKSLKKENKKIKTVREIINFFDSL